MPSRSTTRATTFSTTFSNEHVPASADDDVRLAKNITAPQAPPFSPLDMPPHRPHFASPQPPHLSPPPLLSTQALKHTRPESPPPTSRPPQDATQEDGASSEPPIAHNAERERRRIKEFRMPKPGYVTQTTKSHHRLRSPIPKLHRHLKGLLPPNSDEKKQKTWTQ
jgi:hypothetical protein